MDYTVLATVVIIIVYSLIVIYSATKPAEVLPMAGVVGSSEEPAF